MSRRGLLGRKSRRIILGSESTGGASAGGGGAAQQLTLALDTFLSDGTWTSPTVFYHPDGTLNAVQAEAWGAGGGGTVSTGSGGGGAYARGKVTGLAATTGYAVAAAAAAAANTNGGDSSFNVVSVVAQGGRSGANGGTGGSVAASTGDIKFAGGDGTLGTGATVCGGGAGDAGSGVGAIGGDHTGGPGGSAAFGRALAAGGGSSGVAQRPSERGEVRITYEIPATAGFPCVRARIGRRTMVNEASRTLEIPPGVVAGELLLAVVTSDGAPTITTGGTDAWVKIDQATSSTGAGNEVTQAVFYRIATGTEAGATIETSTDEIVAYVTWRIAAAGIPTLTSATGSSANADPPSHDAGASAKILWIATAGTDANATQGMNGGPANYGALLGLYNGVTNLQGVNCFSAERFLEAQTENPGVFATQNEQWVAYTIAIPPAS